MRIKKVSILGFKSFMDRLDIALPAGISAVVGPNGCGKSNIVDAIRWAMGEQSARQLRGRQMEDVIFSGAGEYKPLGMAEVSLVFESTDRSFPGEYAHLTELSITRRIYRSGESEYLINRVPCRLKDIQEIFMDTGLGNKAYSIIGQGRISSIIEQKPEETRAMLEEAAGITKYRRKVEESRRKVELTRANLQRVEDILSEVERQMRSLKRQAAKAKRYKKLSEEIQDLELTLHANAYSELREEAGKRVRSTEALAAEESGMASRLASRRAEIERMSLELEEKDEEIAGLREAYSRRKEAVSRKESLLESLAGERRMQVTLEERLEAEKVELRSRLERLERERAELEERAASIRENAGALEDEMGLVDRRLKRRSGALREVREQYEAARAEVSEGHSQEKGLDKESGYVNQRMGEIADGRARLEQEKQEVEAKIGRLVEASERKTRTRAALAEKLDRVNEDLEQEREARDELGRIRGRVEADLKKLEADLAGKDSRLASLRSMTENFEGLKVGVRTIMKAEDLDARKEGRVLGLVADVIQVDPELEQAVEAVLADRLQYVIVRGLADGREAVEYLKSRGRGRSSFVPLGDLRPGGNGTGPGNGLPLLKDKVEAPEDYRPLLDALLGNTALARDLGHAVECWAGNGAGQCLVTPDGDMIDEQGVITGGKTAAGSHGLLARKREIRELEGAVAGLRKELDALSGRLEGIDSEMDSKGSRLEALESEREDCREEVNSLDKAALQLGHELDQLQSLSARITSELEQKDKEKERHKQDLTRIRDELARCREEVRKKEEWLQAKEAELKEAEEEVERFRSELGRLRMDVNLAKEEEKGLVRQMERVDDYRSEAGERLEKIDQEIAAAGKTRLECVEREKAVKEELKGLYDELRTAEERVNEAGRLRAELQGGIKDEEKKAQALGSELEGLRERINRARMEHSEIEYKMTGLSDLVMDKFGKDLAKIHADYLVEDFSAPRLKESIEENKRKREGLGEVNLAAIQEHEALEERFRFMSGQRDDLLSSMDALNKAIRKINRISMEKFTETFRQVDDKLKEVFPILFQGGTAGLRLTDEDKPLESGVLVEVKPPGKRLSHMGLLSGGEKALVAMALLFAIYLIKPSPFCLLDEVDAPLDEANIDRFNNLLKEIRRHSQVLLVTHNRRSMEIVERLYGVTMEKAGVSKIVSVSLNGSGERLAA